jgi:hypothetical protein
VSCCPFSRSSDKEEEREKKKEEKEKQKFIDNMLGKSIFP